MTEDSDNKLSFFDVLKSTLMSFFGVQKESVRRRDFTSGNPVHFIIMGLLLTVLFVCSLLFVVNMILP